MANTKEYKIVINGLQESIDAVKSLNEQLKSLEDRIKVLESKTINIKATSSTSTTGGGSKSSSVGQLSEEEKLLKQIEQTERKIKAYSKDIYQNYMASKDQLKEVLNDQKQIAAQERLQANTYSNTMQGLKEKLADIKNVMQTTDIGSDIFKKYTAEANEITNKLKELEEAYGQFGRNVGNYKSAVEGFDKIKVSVGDTVREYDNYKQAVKDLKAERFELSQSIGTEAKAYKDVDVALKKLISDYKDLDVSSAFMDGLLDTMQSFTAIAGIGVGLTQLFGIDDTSFQESMTRLTSLLVVLKSIETLKQQWDKDEGWLLRPFKALSNGLDEIGKKISKSLTVFFYNTTSESLRELYDKYEKEFYEIGVDAAKEWLKGYDESFFDGFEKLTDTEQLNEILNGFINLKVMESQTKKINNIMRVLGTGLKVFFKGVFATITLGLSLVLPEIIEWFTDFIKSLDKTKSVAEQATKSLNALNRSLEKRMELVGSSYMKGQISSEEYLKRIYEEQSDAIEKQISLLQQRADAPLFLFRSVL